MKANEFIKNFGLDEAKIALLYCKSVTSGNVFYKNIQVDIAELKSIIKSYQLVESFGGIEKAMFYCFSKCWKPDGLEKELKKAIEDVKSCQ